MLGKLSLIIKPIMREPIPENKPFKTTISVEPLLDNFLVQLFSKPQHTQAQRIRSEPFENAKADISSKESIIVDTVINNIAVHNFGDIISLKQTKAIIDVATISKLFKSDALAEFVIVKPNIKKIGAAISKTIIPKV